MPTRQRPRQVHTTRARRCDWTSCFVAAGSWFVAAHPRATNSAAPTSPPITPAGAMDERQTQSIGDHATKAIVRLAKTEEKIPFYGHMTCPCTTVTIRRGAEAQRLSRSPRLIIVKRQTAGKKKPP